MQQSKKSQNYFLSTNYVADDLGISKLVMLRMEQVCRMGWIGYQDNWLQQEHLMNFRTLNKFGYISFRNYDAIQEEVIIHFWIKCGLKDNNKKLCQSGNNLNKKRICVIQLRNQAFNEYLVSTQHTKLHFIISLISYFIFASFVFEHEQMFQNVHTNSNKIMYIDKLVLTLP